MFLCDLSLPGSITVRVGHSSDVLSDPRLRLLMRAYLPGVVFLDAPAQSIDLAVYFHEDSRGRLVRRAGEVHLYDAWSGDNGLLELCHLVCSAIRGRWLTQGLYPIHSACAGHLSPEAPEQEGYTLIVGHSGAGKTSTVRRLSCLEGWRILSNNTTMVEIDPSCVIRGVAGTPIVTARVHDLHQHSKVAEKVEYAGRYAFLLEPKAYAPLSTNQIRKIVIVRLNDGVKEFAQLSSASALHTLYPLFLDGINADTVVAGGRDVYVSTVPRGCQRKLARQLRCALEETPVYTVSGSMDHIIDKVVGL